ncbi:penicillin-binding protein 2 [Futiania mangrovi]|uniref:Penicillin-binding protein 2 n=1 Tax=Futiania mangrovi TaxID=2959716 RepID=A0A9J6P8Q4_9PROT|nr:penicillin-binding protein 2 [Futiania mangrovii]MCP1334997.1 penicillin-binding protein 2 [Futiania mangrovii]
MNSTARQHERSFTRRALLLGGLQLGAFVVLGGRLYQLQVVDGEQFLLRAEDNRINMRLLVPERGRILDRNGRPLAVNRPNYRVLIVPEDTEDMEATLDAVAGIVPLDEKTRQRVRRDVARNRSFVPVTVVENLDWETFAAVNAHLPSLPGAVPDVGAARDYPLGHTAAHLVGYVSNVSERDVAAEPDNPLLGQPAFRIGKGGVEKEQDLVLRGQAGSSRVEVNSMGRVIREVGRSDAVAGQDVTLTIDADLQEYAFARLSGESAAACVMDVRVGDVRALVSTPGYDPNSFVTGISRKDWQALLADPYNPLLNKAIAGQYPPGSTFKMLVAMAALESGAVDPGHTVVCNGSYRLGNHTFHCWRRGGHGRVDFKDSLKHSCDVFYYDIARRTGIDQIEAMAKAFGIGTRLDIGLPSEGEGLMPSREWVRAAKGRSWLQGETLITGIGQGAVLATPLQLATMTARIANGGLAIRPRLFRAVGGQELEVPPLRQIPVSDAVMRVVREGMDAVSNEQGGTAYRSRIAHEGLEIAGKTGTSQVRRITKAERARGVTRNEDLPWNRRDHALFVAYAPRHDPRYAISVVVEHGSSGSGAAAPVARDILMETIRRDPILSARLREDTDVERS